jgi:hypothetical protein
MAAVAKILFLHWDIGDIVQCTLCIGSNRWWSGYRKLPMRKRRFEPAHGKNETAKIWQLGCLSDNVVRKPLQLGRGERDWPIRILACPLTYHLNPIDMAFWDESCRFWWSEHEPLARTVPRCATLEKLIWNQSCKKIRQIEYSYFTFTTLL